MCSRKNSFCMGVKEISLNPGLLIPVIYILGKSADNPLQVDMQMCLE